MPARLIDGVRAAVWDGRELVVTAEVAVRRPAPGEVAVRVLASGICHSDLDVIDGASPVPAPVVLGHEGAGIVELLGDGVDGIAVGEEVMISSMTPCGDCPSCRAGRPSRCPTAFGHPTFPFAWRGSAVRSYANVSSFSSVVTVRASQLVPTAGLAPAAAALLGCAVSTGWGAVVNVAQVAPGSTVVVVGVGGIGVNAIAAATLAGAARVVAVDIDPRKEARCPSLRRRRVRHRSRPPSTRSTSVIECSGAPAAIDAQRSRVAPTVALVGVPPAGSELSIDARSLVLGRRLLGSLNGDIVPERDLPRLVELARTGTLDVAGQVTATWPLAEIHDAVTAVRSGDVIRAVLDLT